MLMSGVNRLLIVAIITINAYIIALPIYPTIVFWWQNHINHQPQKLSKLVRSTKSSKVYAQPAKPTPNGEWLVIPKLSMKQQIQEGDSKYTVNKGVWHYPLAGSPSNGGNTVLIGHRFTYKGPSVFFHLDLLKPADSLTLYWNSKQYNYKIQQIKVVSPTDTSIEKQTEDERLTIYTCTPLWSDKSRLVIIAKRAE
jgi:LPXTG-site transpeptidase (sortase) family protein